MIRQTQTIFSRQLQSLINSSFWKKKEKEKTSSQLLKEELEKSENLGHHALSILEKNKTAKKLLPPCKDPTKLTVVMEMDQFLVYTFTPDEEGYLLAPFRRYDFYEEFDQYNAFLSIYLRKNLDNFLSYLKQQCEPVLWTTAVPQYTQLMLKYVDPEKKIQHVLTQEHCDRIIVEKQQIDEFVKDLNLLDRNLSRVVYIDSRPFSYWLHPNNVIPVEAFRADSTMKKQDLDHLILDLQDLKKHHDVRQHFKQIYGIEDHLKQCKLL